MVLVLSLYAKLAMFTCRLMPALIMTATNPNSCFVPQLDPRPFNPGEPHSSAGGCKLHIVHQKPALG